MYRFFSAGVPVSGPRLELNSTSILAYPEQTVKLTCTTRGSPILAWRSDDYMVAGDLIEFLSTQAQGSIINKTSTYNSEIVATLTCVDQANLVLESTLLIVASPRSSTSNITCINNGLGMRDSITLRVLGKKNMIDFVDLLIQL